MKSDITFENLRDCLGGADIAGYLGVAKGTGYEILKQMPHIVIGKRRIVLKSTFAKWLEEQTRD